MNPDEPPPVENRPTQTETTIRIPLRAEHVSVAKRERVRRQPLPTTASGPPADLEATQPLGPDEGRGTLSPTGMDQEPIE